MTRDEHTNIVRQMLGFVKPENQADATQLLTQLTEDYEQTLTKSETLTADNATLTANNEKLRAVNAELFLKVGTTKQQTQETNPKPTTAEETEENKLTFESLFDEKGGLK